MTAPHCCNRCDDAARLIAEDSAAVAHMTAPEIRRAAGEAEFIAGPYSQRMGMELLTGIKHPRVGILSIHTFDRDCIAATLLALVLEAVFAIFTPREAS